VGGQEGIKGLMEVGDWGMPAVLSSSPKDSRNGEDVPNCEQSCQECISLPHGWVASVEEMVHR